MLKFEFDSEKREIFLSFWKLNSVPDFEKLVQNSELFFLRFNHLNPRGFEAICHVIKAEMANQNLVIIDGFFKFNTTPNPSLSSHHFEIDEDTLELLDSLNLVNWLKDRTALLNQRNSYDLTQDFKTWLETIPVLNQPQETHPTDQPEPDVGNTLPKINLKVELSKEEKKILVDIFINYHWNPKKILQHSRDENTLLELKEKKLIEFALIFSQGSLEPTITLKPEMIEIDSKLPSEDTIQYPMEEVAYSLFYLDLKIYELITGKTTKGLAPWEANEKAEFWDHMAKKLIEEGVSQFASLENSSLNQFYQKLFFLLEKSSIVTEMNSSDMIESLPQSLLDFYEELSLINFHPSLLLEELAFLINRRRCFDKKPVLEIAFIKTQLKALNHFGLCLIKKAMVVFEINSLNYLKTHGLNGKKTPTSELEPKNPIMTIDTDMAIMGYKKDLNPSIIYTLLFFCKIEISDHMVMAEFDHNKSSLAWFTKFNIINMLHFFEKYTKGLAKTELEGYLNFYFENNHEFKEEKTIKLTTPSKSYFYKLKYLIQELNLLDHISIFEERKMFIFHDLSSYEQLKSALIDKKMEFIPDIHQN